MKRISKQRTFLKVAGSAACLVGLLGMLGGHWLVLQSFAWARMLAAYSQHDSFRQAISRTFDGKHPCPLCHSIKQGRQQEKAENKTLPAAQTKEAPELLCDLPRTAAPLPPTAATDAVPFAPVCHAIDSTPPPVPPPRRGQARLLQVHLASSLFVSAASRFEPFIPHAEGVRPAGPSCGHAIWTPDQSGPVCSAPSRPLSRVEDDGRAG